MGRIEAQFNFASVPAFLHRHLDRKRGAPAISAAPEIDAYTRARLAGRIPIRLAERNMSLVHQGVGTYTDELGVAWYRDGEEIVRVTDNLDWISKRARQTDVPKGGAVAHTAQTQIQDNSENAQDEIRSPSSKGDFELPQTRGFENPGRRLLRKRKLVKVI